MATPFILLDDARCEGAADARLYRDPAEVVVARSAEEVEAALARIDALNRQGEAFGDQRLLELARENVASDAEQVSEAILGGLATFTGDAPQYDDITMVVVKRDA